MEHPCNGPSGGPEECDVARVDGCVDDISYIPITVLLATRSSPTASRGRSLLPLNHWSTSVSPTRPESDPGPYPLSAVDSRSNNGSDRHAIMVNPTTCALDGLWDTNYHPGGRSTAGSGAIWSLHVQTHCGRPAGLRADAAGLPILPGLVNYDEVSSGSMDHAIRFTAECTTTGRTSGRRDTRQARTTATAHPWVHDSGWTRASVFRRRNALRCAKP